MDTKPAFPALPSVLHLIHQWLAFQVYLQKLPGLSVGIALGSETVFHQQYGSAELENNHALAPDTLFRIASHSKLFTATAIMRLLAQGSLRLDDRIAEHLDWFRSDNDPGLEKITIRHLLTHSSGVIRDGNTRHWTFDETFPDRDSVRKQVWAGIGIFEEGARWKYSNMGYTLLGELIAALTGKNYVQAVTDLVLAPLLLEHTLPEFSEIQRNQHAVGYTHRMPGEARLPIEHRPAGAMSSATGFSSTAADLIRFYQAHLLGDNTLLDDSGKREMQRVQFKDGENEWGLGFRSQEIGGLRYASHGGRYPGFITFSGVNQEWELIIVVLTNAVDGPARELFLGISNLMRLALEMAEDAERGTPAEREEIDSISGFYHSFWGIDAYHRIGGKLVGYEPGLLDPALEMDVYDRVAPLTYRVPNRNPFSAIGEDIAFVPDEAGRITHALWPAGSSARWTIPGSGNPESSPKD